MAQASKVNECRLAFKNTIYKIISLVGCSGSGRSTVVEMYCKEENLGLFQFNQFDYTFKEATDAFIYLLRDLMFYHKKFILLVDDCDVSWRVALKAVLQSFICSSSQGKIVFLISNESQSNFDPSLKVKEIK